MVSDEPTHVEVGVETGGVVVYDEPNFTKAPIPVVTPLTNQTVLATVTSYSKTGFTYVVKARVFWRWRDRTNNISVLWIAIEEQ